MVLASWVIITMARARAPDISSSITCAEPQAGFPKIWISIYCPQAVASRFRNSNAATVPLITGNENRMNPM